MKKPGPRTWFFGACGRTRTGDLLITSELLYQLSHTSIAFQAGIIIASFSSRVNSHFSGDGGKYSLYSQASFWCISRARMVLLFFSRRFSSKSRGWKPPFTSVFRRKRGSVLFSVDLHNTFAIHILRFVIHIIHIVFHIHKSLYFSIFFAIFPF